MILRQQDFRRVTNHASRGQEVRDEARVRDRAPQTARSDLAVYTGPSLQRMALFDMISSVLGVVMLCSLLSIVNGLLKSPVCKCHILYNSSEL